MLNRCREMKAKKRKVKIMYPVTSLHRGGVQSHLLDIVTGLDPEEFEITVAFGIGSEMIAPLEEAGARVVRIRDLIKPIAPRRDFLATRELISLIREVEPDIVHTHMSKASFLGRIAARWCRVPLVVMTAQGWGGFMTHFYRNKLKRRAIFLLEKLMIPITDHVILVAEADRVKVLRMGLCPERKISVISNGIDPGAYRVEVDRTEKRAGLGLDPAIPLAVMVGNLRPQKAPEDLVRAAAAVRETYGPVNFVIVGDGPLREATEKIITDLGVAENCRLLGSRSDVPEILAAADLFVLPSIYEGLCIAILEAMAAALPIVTTNIEENREEVRDGVEGCLVPPRRPDLLAQAVIKVLREPVRAREWGKAGRRRVEELFSRNRMVSKIADLYRRLAPPGAER